jgi:DNA-binding response OmpR family regulator
MAGGKRILCIEDEIEMIDFIKLVLEREGYEVIGAMGGLEGLEAIRREKPDLILLDIMMPGINGWDVYHKIRGNEEICDIPVIVVTARSQDFERILGLYYAEVDDYLIKPFGIRELLHSVEKVLSRRERQGG